MTTRPVWWRLLGLLSIVLCFAGPAASTADAQVTRYVSDMDLGAQFNGWGPIERDRSNGEQAPGDGQTLTIQGMQYAKGIGVHAFSQISVSLFGRCTEFNAVIGVDDEVGDRGSVMFIVQGDETLLYSSATLTGSSPAVPLSLSVRGFRQLRLSVLTTQDGTLFDHADWANATLTCEGAPVSQFTAPVSLPALANPRSVSMVDLNGDGPLDLLVANTGSNAVSVWLGNGDATFGERVDFATGPEPTSATAGDFNGDGRMDLVTSNQGGASVSILLANATGGFGYGAAVDYQACAGAHETAVGDFTSDGIDDLIVACQGGNVVSVLRANGDGTFAPAVPVTVGAGPTSVVAGDFNGDRRLDAAVANHDSANVSVLIGRGDGTFNPQVTYAVGSGPHSIRTGYLDGNGFLDLVVANDASNSISVLTGLATGTFATMRRYPTGLAPKGVAIGDINSDGGPDVLSANTAGNYPVCCNPGGDTIGLLLDQAGASPSSFYGAAQPYTVGTTPFAVWAGDLDGDGDLDVATANWHSNDVTVLTNRSRGQVVRYLSDIPWTSAINGWGPIERDRSNGELGAGDGGTITIGPTYAKGIGVHADSDVRWRHNGQCSSFWAVIGVDDEVGSAGSVYFQVYLDGELRYMSPLMTGTSFPLGVNVNVSGGNELRLFVHYGWDDYFADHADWADARITCSVPEN